VRPTAVFKALTAIFLIVFAALSAQAQSLLQPIPPLTGHVVDTSGTLQPAQVAALDAKLATLEQEKGSQVVVLMVKTTAPEDIAAFANRVGNTWKIGRKDVGDGLIVLVAVQDKRMRIEVAKTLEGAVPDIAAKQVIDEAMAPHFRQGDYAGGLSAAVDQLAARIKGEPLPPVKAPSARDRAGDAGGFDLFQGLIFLFIAVPVISAVARGIFGRKLGALMTGAGVGGLTYLVTVSLALALGAGVVALIFALFAGVMSSLPVSRGRGSGPVFLPPGGWGGGGGGFGGGGFGGGGGWSSGGGGDFGGGGASGSW